MKSKANPSFNKIIVLMYHRITDAETDPWEICVSPQHFDEHIRFLKSNFNVISTGEALKQLKLYNIKSNSTCITFDDGYADNYTHAKPLLEKYNFPATFFIPTAFINQDVFFWWDELEMIFLHFKKLPQRLSLTVDGDINTYTIDEIVLTDQQWLEHQQWKWYKEPPTKRCEVFLNIWEKLRPQSHEEIQKQMIAIKEWAGINEHVFTNRSCMDEEQLNDLSKNSLFTIGTHTHTHVDLYEKELQHQLKEIIHCKEVLNNKYGIKSNSLAYPYGRYDDITIKAVKELQLDMCFTTESVGININADTTKLGRFQVCDWNKEIFKNQLTKWCE